MKSRLFHDHFLINREQRFIYCFVPKAACTSIKHWFLQVSGVPIDAKLDVHRYAAEHYSLARIPRKEARQLLCSPDYYRFAFLRNPFSRLVSAYLNKIVHPEGPGIPEINRFHRGRLWQLRKRGNYALRKWMTGSGIDSDLGMTFREFVHHLAGTRPRRLESHWRPQHMILGNVQFNFVGLIENIQVDFERLCCELGLPIQLSQINRTARGRIEMPPESCADWTTRQLRALKVSPPFECFYTPELTKVVGRIYQQDWAKFSELSQNGRGDASLRALPRAVA